MTTRKTYSLPDDVAASVEDEATRQGRSASSLVSEGMTRYLASLRTSHLSGWVGKGRSSGKPHDLDRELLSVLDRKHPRRTSDRRR